MGGRRHHKDCYQIFLRIYPETGTGVTAFVIFTHVTQERSSGDNPDVETESIAVADPGSVSTITSIAQRAQMVG